MCCVFGIEILENRTTNGEKGGAQVAGIRSLIGFEL